ncbi:MAG: mannose-1-phosphate guanylyltransferase/mannose-6-phosphate isomerase [Candidatus Omnitrophota bacterium]|nr:MAG: mannose-1-phosphate guanylyltransferase/mannose-6-phosphate isomerase [Candidatus Omnitrophota bacterium]
MKKFALILCGGKGTRLWPLSRENYPKQFVKIINHTSLFQNTIKRILPFFPSQNIFILSSEGYKFNILNQIEELKCLSKKTKNNLRRNLLLEPLPRNTAPAILFFLKIKEELIDEKDLLFIFPSDHIIQPQEKFISSLKKAEQIACYDKLVIFGIKPKYPHSGFGYIVAGNRFRKGFKVKRFIEKPSLKKCKELIKIKALWNAGIFCFKKGVFLDEIKRYSPQLLKYYFQKKEIFLNNFYQLPEKSIDYAIMQKTKTAVVVKLDLRWSDLGNWDSFFEYFSNRRGNFSLGTTYFFKSKNCLSFSQSRLISLLGVEDIIVVEDSDVILVMKKGFSDRLKKFLAMLKKEKIPQVELGLTVWRPWGYYTVLIEKKNYKVKEIGIYPKKAISLQKHKYRSEHWNVVEGKAEVTLGSRRVIIKKNESIFVPRGLKHRVFNPTNRITKIIEVQIGSYVGEDDIERFTTYEEI